MTVQQEIGDLGEGHAVAYLQTKGYRVAARNWRWRRAEIDIIAWDGDILVFIEVKTRSHGQHGHPVESIDRKKMHLLAMAAGAYMRQINYEWEVRFDSIAVTHLGDHLFGVEHFEDIFFPGRYG